MIEQTVVMVNMTPMIVTFEGKRILQVMRPDGSTFEPTNMRFIKRVRAQLPMPNMTPCEPDELAQAEVDYQRVSLKHANGTFRTTDEVRARALEIRKATQDAQ